MEKSLNCDSNPILAESNLSQSGSNLLVPRFLLGRLYFLAAVLTFDCALLAITPHSAPLLGPIAPCGIVSFAVFFSLAYRRLKTHRNAIPFQPLLLLVHIFLVAAVCLGAHRAAQSPASWLNSSPGVLASGAFLILGILLLALACIPFSSWIDTARDTSPAWQYSFLAGLAAWFLRSPFQNLWIHSSSSNVYLLQIIAFRAVQGILRFLLPGLIVQNGPFLLGTPRFTVSIGAPCSGIEGLGLVLVFTSVWLWFFRKENRFPQALLLIPCALLSVFLLNIVRIAALILIGNAGAPEIAIVGFHSQAGWIAFTLVALSFSMAAQKLSWVRKAPIASSREPRQPLRHTGTVLNPAAQESYGESPATAAYLLPFLAILGASFLSKSASGYFEWLYPLRFVAAAIALWLFRHDYRKLNWRCGWLAPLTGIAIFLLWIAPEAWAHNASSGSLGNALAALSPAARLTWIAFRVAAAVVTVPLAEELAFRGYLARRIQSRSFDQISFTRLSLVSIAVSSLAFGLMHGQHWLVGILAGLAFAFLLRARGRMGDAVVAHAVANLLLAAWVLFRGDWGLW